MNFEKTDLTTNLHVYREGRKVTVQGLVVVNGTSTSITLPHPAIEETRLIAIGLSNTFILSGYGFGSVKGTICNIAMTGAITYAVVNFTYYTSP